MILYVRGVKKKRTKFRGKRLEGGPYYKSKTEFFFYSDLRCELRGPQCRAQKKKTSSLIYSMDRENEVSKTFIIKKGKLFFIPTIDRFLSFLLRWLVDKYLLLNFNKKGFIYLFGSVLNEKKLRKIVHHTGFKKMWIYLWDKSAISNSIL